MIKIAPAFKFIKHRSASKYRYYFEENLNNKIIINYT